MKKEKKGKMKMKKAVSIPRGKFDSFVLGIGHGIKDFPLVNETTIKRFNDVRNKIYRIHSKRKVLILIPRSCIAIRTEIVGNGTKMCRGKYLPNFSGGKLLQECIPLSSGREQM